MRSARSMGGFSSTGSRLALMVLVLAILLVVLLGCSSVCHGWHLIPRGKTTVTVRNDISPNTLLTIHCKSGDDDLGEQKLSNGQSFSWRFTPNLWGTTLYWCNFWWHDSYGELVRGGYQVYKTKRDELCCFTNCIRSARADGLYGNQNSPGSDYEKMYDWPK